MFALGHAFELGLHTKDRPLSAGTRGGCVAAREAAAKEDARRLGKDADVATEAPPHRLEHGRLARARPTGQDDELGIVTRWGTCAVSRHDDQDCKRRAASRRPVWVLPAFLLDLVIGSVTPPANVMAAVTGLPPPGSA